jgi:hypothetical protein
MASARVASCAIVSFVLQGVAPVLARANCGRASITGEKLDGPSGRPARCSHAEVVQDVG